LERLTVPAPENQAAFDFIGQVLRHPSSRRVLAETNPVDRLADIDIPVYSIANSNQAGLHFRGNLYGYEHVRGPKKLLVNGGLIGAAHSFINIFNDQGARPNSPSASARPAAASRRPKTCGATWASAGPHLLRFTVTAGRANPKCRCPMLQAAALW